jgi:osmotically-inducible protein OsmY
MASVPRPTPSISERLNDELAANKKLRRVHAYAVGGNVTLTGKVFDDGDKRLAENTARNVRGVTSVTNNLTTDQQDWAMNAARITQQLQAAGLTGVTVRVIGKTAYLNGTVSSAADRERAVMIAQSAAPVTVRVNLINVAPGRVFGF